MLQNWFVFVWESERVPVCPQGKEEKNRESQAKKPESHPESPRLPRPQHSHGRTGGAGKKVR